MKMPLSERIKRFFFSKGDYGLYRSVKKANNLDTAQFSTEMNILSNMFERSKLMEEIENERYELKKDFEEFHTKFMNREFHVNEKKKDEAEKINDEFNLRIEKLQKKIDELENIKNSIKNLKAQNENQKNEFENEMRLHKIRFNEDYDKGRY